MLLVVPQKSQVTSHVCALRPAHVKRPIMHIIPVGEDAVNWHANGHAKGSPQSEQKSKSQLVKPASIPALQLGRVSSQGGGSSSAGSIVASTIATPPTKSTHLALKAVTGEANQGAEL